MNDLLDRRPHLDTAVRRFNPAIPPSLEAIVVKCLALQPDERYADAESLAQDLERFLNHQPLLKAGNPSRREQLGNCWMRQRRRLTQVGLIGVAALIFTAALARPVCEWLWPAEPSGSKFQSAVVAVERGDNSAMSARALTQVLAAFPRSCLARFYLAFALKDDRQRQYDATRYLREALAVAGAEEIVLEWVDEHPEFCPLLVDFVEAGILRADEFIQKYDKDDPVREEEIDSELRKPVYEPLGQALELAEKLDPASLNILRLRAKTEEMLGKYESSYERLSRAIDATSTESYAQRDILFFCRHLRGRVAFLWIEQRRREGPAVDDESMKLLQNAVQDLKVCWGYLEGHYYSDGRKLKTYRVLHDLLRATLTLAEIQMDLQRPDDAGKQLRASTRLMKKLKEDIDLAGLDDSKIASLKRRLEKATRRHKDAERIASTR